MKRFVLALVLLASPLPAFAACSNGTDQAMSCAEGSMWDSKTQACVPVVMG